MNNRRLKNVVVVVSFLTVMFLAVVWLSFTGTAAWIGTGIVLLVAIVLGFISYRGTEPWFEKKGTWFEEDEG